MKGASPFKTVSILSHISHFFPTQTISSKQEIFHIEPNWVNFLQMPNILPICCILEP